MSVIRGLACMAILPGDAVLLVVTFICLFTAVADLFLHDSECCRPLARCGKFFLPLAGAAAGAAVFWADALFAWGGLYRKALPSGLVSLGLLAATIAVPIGMHRAAMWSMDCSPRRARGVSYPVSW